MYEVYIDEELKEDSYNKLIEYALSKSDAFMLVVYRHPDDIERVFRAPRKDKNISNKLYKMILERYEEDKKQEYINKDIFNKNTELFLHGLEKHLIKKRNFPTEWPGSKIVLSGGSKVDICVYRNCDEIKDFLLQPKGLFNWKYPYFPDDLCFFKNGYCWFYTVAHEEFSFMFVESEEEIKKLKKIGFNFRFKACDKSELPLFYEDYKLY